MRLGVLFSGGKDSTYAMFKAMQEHDIVCLISLFSINPESYMFHTPNIDLTKLQAEAIGLPHLTFETKGEKEKELKDLKTIIKKAVRLYNLDGILTGALASEYQRMRIQNICDDLNIACINPLWKLNQIDLLNQIVNYCFEVVITAVAAYPFDESWLGQTLDKSLISKLETLAVKYKINPAGEGGEYESLVIDAPFFNKKLRIIESRKVFHKNSGMLIIEKADLGEKPF